MTRPKLGVEKLIDKEVTHDELSKFLFNGQDYNFPHCEARILHLPEECEYCAAATELQAERERLDVSNSGHTNRKWPCPVERARSLKGAHEWHGNVPRKEGEKDPYTEGLIEALTNSLCPSCGHRTIKDAGDTYRCDTCTVEFLEPGDGRPAKTLTRA